MVERKVGEPPAYHDDLCLFLDLLTSEIRWRCGFQDEPPQGMDFPEISEREYYHVMGVVEIAVEACNQISFPEGVPEGWTIGDVNILNALVGKGTAKFAKGVVE